MSWLATLVSCVLIAGGAQAQDDAKKLFDVAEQQLLDAEAYKMSFNTDSIFLTGKGSFIAAKGNRVKIVYEDLMVAVGEFDFVSDGQKVVTKNSIKNNEMTEKPAHDKMSERLTGWFIRAGLQYAFAKATAGPEDFAKAELSGFKMLGKDKVDDRDTQVIGYQLMLGEDEIYTCQLWIDVQTGLPLKRSMQDGYSSIVEFYTNWDLDPKLPAGTFKLPK